MKEKKKPLKILIINYEHPPLGGGGGVCTQNLAHELVKKGHTVHILTTAIKGFPRVSDDKGATIFRVPVIGRSDLNVASNISMLTFPITSIPKGLLLCLKYKYDIINTHFYAPSGPTGLAVSLLTGIPNVLYIHGADVYDPSRMNKTPAGKGMLSRLLRTSARVQNSLARSIACQSTNTYENIHKYIKPKKNVTIIPLPFRKPVPVKATKRSLGLDPKKFYLLSVGRAVKRKGYEYLVKALPNLNSSIHQLIVGDGPVIQELKEMASELGVADRLHCLGYIREDDKKYKYYAASDLFVLSSLHEGMGIIVQEAMELGLPVVATNHGGQVDLIKDNINGLLVPPENAELLAAAVKKLYSSTSLRKKFGLKNKEIIKDYYAPVIAERFLSLFYDNIRK